MMDLATNHPFDNVVANMERLAREGALCFLKFTCVHCGARQTASDPNTIHSGGYSCEECGKLTTLADLKRDGINFLLVQRFPQEESRGRQP